jgi:hypothetical protein
MPKCMANASFYRPKFGIIDLMNNKRVGGQPFTWWLTLNFVGRPKTSLLTSEFEMIFCMKVLVICLIFPTKQE